MSELSKTSYGKRLESYRKRSGKTIPEMASMVGVTFESYVDLEMQENELFDCISLRKLRLLAKTLGFNLVEFFSDGGEVPLDSVTLEQLADKIKHYISEHNVTVRQFEVEAGWQVEKALIKPTEFLDLNLTGLKDVCNKVGMSWLSVLSALDTLQAG